MPAGSGVDDDKDGWLDKSDAKDSADVDNHWTRLDKDRDGRISSAEFTSNFKADAKR